MVYYIYTFYWIVKTYEKKMFTFVPMSLRMKLCTVFSYFQVLFFFECKECQDSINVNLIKKEYCSIQMHACPSCEDLRTAQTCSLNFSLALWLRIFWKIYHRSHFTVNKALINLEKMKNFMH